jgi:hypothetical protein
VVVVNETLRQQPPQQPSVLIESHRQRELSGEPRLLARLRASNRQDCAALHTLTNRDGNVDLPFMDLE